MKQPKLTHHIEFDVPDDLAGSIQRVLTGYKGIVNMSSQPNGTTRRKGEAPSKMNGATKRDVVMACVSKTGKATRSDILEALRAANLPTPGVGSTINGMVTSKLIRRTGKATYAVVK